MTLEDEVQIKNLPDRARRMVESLYERERVPKPDPPEGGTYESMYVEEWVIWTINHLLRRIEELERRLFTKE